MAKRIFLDANAFIDILEDREGVKAKDLVGNVLFISVLTLHIYVYSYKITIPSDTVSLLKSQFTYVDVTSSISEKSMTGPTSDFEDNIQLHSAIESKADLFITRDKKLLSLGYFGACRIVDSV
ncbi:hypothetical protein CO180_04345 [candidate division WWE3 bacterium CG_4_9_14_3_um_filter_41_6]|nr:MAG: hypothetical protein CO180_04345 [candidate division WWE3 bacterium CG_4_9_14_3_um_filter_41_6]